MKVKLPLNTDMEGEVAEIIEQQLPSVSPTLQSDLSTDGDILGTPLSSVSKMSPIPMDTGSEPKAKKRRKQSNPLKIQNPDSPKYDMPPYQMEEQPEEMMVSLPEENEIPPLPEENAPSPCSLPEIKKLLDYGPQKGSLSRVTNALFNNKLREAAKVSTGSTKSKDSSSRDISSPESNEDVLSNTDFKAMLAYQQFTPILPMIPADMAKDVSKLSSIYNFGEYPSPIQQNNIGLSISQRSFVTSSGVRVFNPEAYCELCEKEFCNKYFLKTHKANKHGICTSEGTPGGYNYRGAYKNIQANTSPITQPTNIMNESGTAYGPADSYCNVCQKYFCNKYFLKKHRQNIHGIHEEASPIQNSIHVPVISSPSLTIRPIGNQESSKSSSDLASLLATKDDDSQLNVSLENIKNSLNSTMLSILNATSPQPIPHQKSLSFAAAIHKTEKKMPSEKFLCDICNIEFCEKSFLEVHKMNKHGTAKKTDFPDFSEVGKVETSNDKPSSSQELEEHFKDQMCAPCMKNFTSAESFQNHMLEVHGASLKDEDESSATSDNRKSLIEMDVADKSPSSHELESSNGSSDSGTFNCTMCLMKYKDRRSFMQHLESEHNIPVVVEKSLTEGPYTCDACPDQYFIDSISLMVHKFNHHGVMYPRFEGFSDAIENSDSLLYAGMRQKSGGTSFCQICNKELCNKYFMKTHMLKMHGIDVEKTPLDKVTGSPSGGGGVHCDICHKFLCSKYFLKIHKQNVHGINDDSIKITMVSSLAVNNNNNVVMSVKKEDAFEPALKIQGSTTVEPCPPISVVENGVKSPFSCEICGQEFSDKITLQHHLVNKHVKCNDTTVKIIDDSPNYPPPPEDPKDVLKSGVLPCSCCSYVIADNSLTLSPSEMKVSCILCHMTYHQRDYHTHHLSHGVSLPVGKRLENGVHDLNVRTNGLDLNKHQRPKFKRFRCSKCDKTFRTKLRCLRHIQAIHKSRKGLPNHLESPKKGLANHVAASRKMENGKGLLSLPDGSHAPAPYVLADNSDVIMQPFHLAEPSPDGVTKQNLFVPSLVYLPVSKKVSETLTVAFTLTPA